MTDCEMEYRALPFTRDQERLRALFGAGPLTLKQINQIGSGGVFLANMAAQEAIEKRSQREGTVLLYMEKRGLIAALLFQGLFYSWLELPFSAALEPQEDRQAFLEWFLPALEDFRLGWLPQEKAILYGGVICRTEELPSEAEGFVPLWAAGSMAEMLQGHGRIMGDTLTAS